MRLFIRSAVVLLCLTGAACEGVEGGAKTTEKAAAGPDIGETIAKVNGVAVGSKEFEQAAARKSPAAGDALSMEEKKEVLDGLVEEKLLYSKALDKGLDKDPKVQKVMVTTLVRDEVYASVRNSDFTDEVLQKYYDDHKDEFVVPEKVQIKRILIKVTEARPEGQAKAEAEKVRAEVAAKPEGFKDVAARVSEDPYKRRGGDVGFVSKEGKPGLDPVIVDKAFTLDVGQISDVFKTAEGFNIIQVATKRERVERTFQQMKGSVLRKVKNEKMKELYDDYVAKLKQGADIQIDEAKLQALEIKSSRRALGAGMGAGEEGEEGEEGLDEGGMGEGLRAPGVEGAVPGAPEPPGTITAPPAPGEMKAPPGGMKPPAPGAEKGK